MLRRSIFALPLILSAPSVWAAPQKAPIKKPFPKPKLIALHAQEPDRALMLKSDVGMKWGKMRAAFFDLRDIGFKGVLLKVTERKKPGQPGDGA